VVHRGQRVPLPRLNREGLPCSRAWFVVCLRAGAVAVLLIQFGADAAEMVASLEGAGLHVVFDPTVGGTHSVDVHSFDAIVIGVADGLEKRLALCRDLRSSGCAAAIIAMSAEASELTKLLDAGADDFAVVPVEPNELVARVRAALRRTGTRGRTHWGPWSIDRAHRSVSIRGRVLSLTALEYAVLAYLLEAGGEVVPRGELLARVWGHADDPGSNLVEVHLSRIRDKLGGDAALLDTVRRAGYRLRRE
jgi:DNA-binding response OmpR family regulator